MEDMPITAEPAPRCEVRSGGLARGSSALGEAFVAALAWQDFDALRELMADDVRLRLLVPTGPQEEVGEVATAGRFRTWFADADPILLESWETADVADRLAVGYRFRLRKPEGWRLIEQRLVADLDRAGRLAAIDLLCSGFRPVSGGPDEGGG
jgi:hypothetical protein